MEEKLSLPFLTREMLAFKGSAVFDLEVVTGSKLATPIEITGMTREGPFKYSLTTDGATAAQTTIFRIPDVPIFLTVKTAGVVASVNDVYSMVYLRANETRIQLLCQGFIGQFHGINYPNQVPMSPLQMKGASGATNSADPAANNEFSITVPAGEYWLLNRVVVTLVTDATVATRKVVLNIIDTGGNYSKFVVPSSHSASITYMYNWFVGSNYATDTDNRIQNTALPSELILAPGFIISSSTLNRQAGDDYGIAHAYYERFYAA